MIRLATIFLLVLLGFSGTAQRINREDMFVKRGLFNIQSGIAIPVKDFADDNFKLASGYARPGYNIRLGLNYDVSPCLGLALQYQYTSNPFNSSKYLADLQKANTGSLYTFNSYTSNPWTLQGLMVGVYYPFRAYRTTIDFKILTGFLTGSLPENTVNYTYRGTDNFNIKQFETSSTDLGYQAGLNIRYQLYKSLILTGSADFTYTEIVYKDIVAQETNTGIRLSLPSYKQYYHIINLSAGIGIQFN